jgi:hypothetical protein
MRDVVNPALREHGCRFARMDAKSNIAMALPSLDLSLAHLSDDAVLAGTRRLVGRSNLLLAELLAHLAEVEARGIHRIRACSSLYAYCIYELRFSEDEAFRRVAAARLVRRFPMLLDALAAGELHLTGLLMLGPHLTNTNLTEVLARAKHRTKRELARLVRVLDPLPAVPACIEPLGPALARATPAEPTWEGFVHSFSPVRELSPGERPRDWLATDTGTRWIEASDTSLVDTAEETTADIAAPARVASAEEPMTTADVAAPAPVSSPAAVRVAPESLVPSLASESLAPERYKVQFTSTAEYVRLVEEAQALLSHAAPRAALDEIHLRAMRAFVTLLRKQKYATLRAPGLEPQPDAPRQPQSQAAHEPEASPSPSMSSSASQRSSGKAAASEPETRSAQAGLSTSNPRQRHQRGRYIPAAVRRAVFNRDGQQCTYVDPAGRRCQETHHLDFHHREPFAWGGEHTAANVTLHCAVHNALAAENDFGHEFMAVAKPCHGEHDG